MAAPATATGTILSTATEVVWEVVMPIARRAGSSTDSVAVWRARAWPTTSSPTTAASAAKADSAADSSEITRRIAPSVAAGMESSQPGPTATMARSA